MEGEDRLWAFHVNVILYISSIFSKISYASFIRPIILMMHGFLIGISSKISHLAYTFSKSELMLSWSIFRACKVGEVLKLYQYKAQTSGLSSCVNPNLSHRKSRSCISCSASQSHSTSVPVQACCSPCLLYHQVCLEYPSTPSDTIYSLHHSEHPLTTYLCHRWQEQQAQNCCHFRTPCIEENAWLEHNSFSILCTNSGFKGCFHLIVVTHDESALPPWKPTAMCHQ